MSVSIVINTLGATPDAVARALESIGVTPPKHEVLLLGGDLNDPAWQRAIGPHKANLRHLPAAGLSPSEARNHAVAEADTPYLIVAVIYASPIKHDAILCQFRAISYNTYWVPVGINCIKFFHQTAFRLK